ASSANALGNVSDNKVLMNTLVLRALLDEPEFAASCRQLAKEAKSVPEDVRRVAFDLAKPLIALQPREADTIAKRLAASLDLAEVPVSEWLAAFWQGTQQGVTELLSRLMSGRDARLERLELFGQIFDQPALREALERYRAERSSAAEQ